jgi:hypothetical protein
LISFLFSFFLSSQCYCSRSLHFISCTQQPQTTTTTTPSLLHLDVNTKVELWQAASSSQDGGGPRQGVREREDKEGTALAAANRGSGTHANDDEDGTDSPGVDASGAFFLEDDELERRLAAAAAAAASAGTGISRPVSRRPSLNANLGSQDNHDDMQTVISALSGDETYFYMPPAAPELPPEIAAMKEVRTPSHHSHLSICPSVHLSHQMPS